MVKHVSDGKSSSIKGLKVQTAVKAGGFNIQHNRRGIRPNPFASGLKVQAAVKAGGFNLQHNRRGIRLRQWTERRPTASDR